MIHYFSGRGPGAGSDDGGDSASIQIMDFPEPSQDVDVIDLTERVESLMNWYTEVILLKKVLLFVSGLYGWLGWIVNTGLLSTYWSLKESYHLFVPGYSESDNDGANSLIFLNNSLYCLIKP